MDAFDDFITEEDALEEEADEEPRERGMNDDFGLDEEEDVDFV